MERARVLQVGFVTLSAGGLGIMPVRHVFGLRGARCTGAGEGVQNSPLYPVIPGSAGPGRVGRKLPSIRCGAPKGERPCKGPRLFPVTGAVLSGLCLVTGGSPPRRSALRFPRYRGKQSGNASVEAKIFSIASEPLAHVAARERDRLTLPCRGRDAHQRCAGWGRDEA